MSDKTNGKRPHASNLQPPSRAHRRELAVQRDRLASRTKRPDRRGLEDIDNPGLMVGGGALALWGLSHWRSALGLMAAGIGGGLVYQGLRQNQLLDGNLKQRLLNTGASQTTQARASITIDRPVSQVFSQWRDMANMAQCMRFIESVDRRDDTHWHWKARIPRTHMSVEWDSEIVEEREDEVLVWRSVAGSEIQNEGMVEFNDRPGDSTEMHAHIVYYPPAGKVGGRIAKFLHGLTDRIIKEDLRRFKQLMETGEVPTTAGQSSGRKDNSSALRLPRGDHSNADGRSRPTR